MRRRNSFDFLRRLFDFQIRCGRFAALLSDFVRNLLAFVEALKPGRLDSRNVDKHVLAAFIGLDKTVTLGGVTPFHCA